MDRETPSANTVKRALRQGPVFVSTLERIWAYFRRRASAEGRESLPPLQEGEDYVFTEPATARGAGEAVAEVAPQRGWLSQRVPPPNRLFTGRREVLDHLHAAFIAGSSGAAPGDPQALTGLGGIGKTQTALAYVYAHRDAYSRVFWIGAETVEALHDGLAACTGELGLGDTGAGAVPDRKEALARAYDWFRLETGWLLVLDNADDLETLAPHFPRHHGGCLLLTTRARNPVRWAAPHRLAKFSPEEGALLLLRRAGVIDREQSLADAPAAEAAAAAELSAELGGLPLAISQAGAYLAESTLSVADYLARYRQHGLELLDRAEDGDHAPVAVTFRLALERMARQGDTGRAAVALIHLSAFLAPDAIPQTVLAGPEEEADDEAARAAICAYSLAAWNPADRTLSVHRLVQAAARAALSPGERRVFAARAVHAVAGATPDFEFTDWALCDLLLPHWRLCARHIAEGSIETAEAVHLLFQAGRYLRARALYGEAESFLRSALALSERVHGAVHGATAECLDGLACLYREIDRGNEAEPLHLRALTVTEAVQGADHPDTAALLHNLALFYAERQDYDRAEALFLRSLAIRERYPGQDELVTAATLTQLASLYRYREAFDRAEEYFLRAGQIYARVLEPGHVDRATSDNNLGLLYVSMGRYAEAEALFQRALQINERARGRDHPETGTVVWSLAWACAKQERVEEADRLFQRAVAIHRKHFNEGHTRLTRLLSHYADFRKTAGLTGAEAGVTS
jgi:FOG: TPR repeat